MPFRLLNTYRCSYGRDEAFSYGFVRQCGSSAFPYKERYIRNGAALCGELSLWAACRFFRDAAVFFVVIAAVYMLGYFKCEEAATVQCVSFLTYVAIYFYGTNILRNARMVTHEGGTLFRVLDFLYYMFSLRVLKRNACLKNYLEWYENEHKNCI